MDILKSMSAEVIKVSSADGGLSDCLITIKEINKINPEKTNPEKIFEWRELYQVGFVT